MQFVFYLCGKKGAVMPRGGHFVPRSDIFNRVPAGQWAQPEPRAARHGRRPVHRTMDTLTVFLSAPLNMPDPDWLQKATNAARNLYGFTGFTGHCVCVCGECVCVGTGVL